MTEVRCPLCRQTVSQELFEKITGIWRERRVQEKALKAKQKELVKKHVEETKKLEAERKNLKTEQKAAIEKKVAEQTKKYDAQLARIESQKERMVRQMDKKIASATKQAERRARIEVERIAKQQLEESVKRAVEKASGKQTKDLVKAQRTLESTRKQMSTLQLNSTKQQEKIRNLEIQLKNQTTPQIEGLLYEDKLLDALKKEFQEDGFTHTGKGGDILQEVRNKKEPQGLIIYECKKVMHWSSAHVEQAYSAKIQRKADFAVLVTNASRRGSSGFFLEKGVLVINPGGALALANILREQIIRIAQLKLTKAQKEEAVERTLCYLQGAEFKNALELVIRKTREMYDDLKKECNDHVKSWKRRHDALHVVYAHTMQVQVKTAHLISGGEAAEAKACEPQGLPSLPDLKTLLSQ